jgi:hypothetical protein
MLQVWDNEFINRAKDLYYNGSLAIMTTAILNNITVSQDLAFLHSCSSFYTTFVLDSKCYELLVVMKHSATALACNLTQHLKNLEMFNSLILFSPLTSDVHSELYPGQLGWRGKTVE